MNYLKKGNKMKTAIKLAKKATWLTLVAIDIKSVKSYWKYSESVLEKIEKQILMSEQHEHITKVGEFADLYIYEDHSAIATNTDDYRVWSKLPAKYLKLAALRYGEK